MAAAERPRSQKRLLAAGSEPRSNVLGVQIALVRRFFCWIAFGFSFVTSWELRNCQVTAFSQLLWQACVGCFGNHRADPLELQKPPGQGCAKQSNRTFLYIQHSRRIQSLCDVTVRKLDAQLVAWKRCGAISRNRELLKK